MFEPIALNEYQRSLCQRTISSNTFYMLVGDALVAKKPLSVVRMGDGEVQLLKAAQKGLPSGYVDSHPEEWLRRMGCYGISRGELTRRLQWAANECTYFAPSVSGIQLEGFRLHSLFNTRESYVDNFWCNAWTEEMKIQLFKTAKHILFIHRNTASADALQIRAKYALDVKVTYLKLENWLQAWDVVDQAAYVGAPLVLFSAGPASKFIGPKIATGGRTPKVTLDIGNAADQWLLSSLKDIPAGRR